MPPPLRWLRRQDTNSGWAVGAEISVSDRRVHHCDSLSQRESSTSSPLIAQLTCYVETDLFARWSTYSSRPPRSRPRPAVSIAAVMRSSLARKSRAAAVCYRQAPARKIRRWSLRSRESADHVGEQFAVDLLGRGVHGARSIVVADAAARILRRCFWSRAARLDRTFLAQGFVATLYDFGQSCDLQRYWWARRGSNPRPLVCKTRALPLSYTPVRGKATRRRRVTRNPFNRSAGPPAPRSTRLDHAVPQATSSRRTE